jgi:AmiR/NasT family two-component response regulator
MASLDAKVDELQECQEQLGNLRTKLESLPAIEQAKGILISEEGYSDDEAFDVLRTASMRENRKLRDLAGDLVNKARTRARRGRNAEA